MAKCPTTPITVYTNLLFHEFTNFRASIWWKYLDGESVLPPPFTVFYLAHKLAESAYRKIAETIITKTAAANSDVESPKLRRKHNHRGL